ncbi:hypothetical protein LMG28690_01399 [Paraburkholderia caffeinilytica]|nr:hypothetical protein LMG28690_01399 [Paraburkholderia caffeinilytica]
MIAERKYRAVSFLAARVKSRLRFAAPSATKQGEHWRTGRCGCGASEQTVSDGFWPIAPARRTLSRAAVGLINGSFPASGANARSRPMSCHWGKNSWRPLNVQIGRVHR